MTDFGGGLDFELRELASSLDRLSVRGKAAIFGACGRALAPLVKMVEQRSNEALTFPDLDPALDLIEAFAIGSVEAADHSVLRGRLMAAVPHGDDLDAPLSTYVQDALICADAGLAAASVDARPKPIWIQYVLEPLMASMQIRDLGIIRARGNGYWSTTIVNDPAMAAALGFLRGSMARELRDAPVGQLDYRRLVEEAAVLRPAGL